MWCRPTKTMQLQWPARQGSRVRTGTDTFTSRGPSAACGAQPKRGRLHPNRRPCLRKPCWYLTSQTDSSIPLSSKRRKTAPSLGRHTIGNPTGPMQEGALDAKVAFPSGPSAGFALGPRTGRPSHVRPWPRPARENIDAAPIPARRFQRDPLHTGHERQTGERCANPAGVPADESSLSLIRALAISPSGCRPRPPAEAMFPNGRVLSAA